jgi:hypothetical protein
VILARVRWLTSLRKHVGWCDDWLTQTLRALDGERFSYPRD